MAKGFGDMIKQAQRLQKQMMDMQEELAKKTVEGTAGGGMVNVTANTAQQVLEVKIAPEVVDPADVEMLEDLVLAAVNQALTNAKTTAEKELAQVTGGMMPGLGNMGF